MKMRSYLIWTFLLSISVGLPAQLSHAQQRSQRNLKTQNISLKLNQKQSQKLRKGDRVRIQRSASQKPLNGKVVNRKGKKAIVKLNRKRSIQRRQRVKVSKQQSFRTKPPVALQKKARAKPGKQVTTLPEFGTAVFPVPAVGLTLGLEMSPSSFIELNYSRGELTGNEQRAAGESFGVTSLMTTEVASLRLKKFWAGTSFYTNSGIGYRNVTFSGRVNELDPELGLTNVEVGDELFSETRQDFVVDLAIGNRWSSGRFSFGVDWFGLLVPFASAGLSPDSSNSVGVDSDNSDGYDEYYEYSMPGVSYQSKLYLGLNF